MRWKNMALIVLLGLGLVSPAVAQTAPTQTALSAAVSDSSSTLVTLVSTTGVTASTQTQTNYLYIGTELMRVSAVNTTTNVVTVVRGVGGIASPHASGAIVTFGVTGAVDRANGVTSGVFITQAPLGSCTASDQTYSLVVNYQTDEYFRCNSTTSTWQLANYRFGDGFESVHDPGNAAYTATLLDRFIDYTTTTAARTVTLPSVTALYGKVLTVSNHTTGAYQSITLSAANGQLINGSATYVLGHGSGDGSTNSVTVVSVGGAWRIVGEHDP